MGAAAESELDGDEVDEGLLTAVAALHLEVVAAPLLSLWTGSTLGESRMSDGGRGRGGGGDGGNSNDALEMGFG